VIIKTFRKGAEYTLTVIRNQQGVFQPALASSAFSNFWRFTKPEGSQSKQIMNGDLVRLTWRVEQAPAATS
jgi:hypothetical protein